MTKGHEIATQWAARGEASRVSTQAELAALGQELESKRTALAAIDVLKKAAEGVGEKGAAPPPPTPTPTHPPPLPSPPRAVRV